MSFRTRIAFTLVVGYSAIGLASCGPSGPAASCHYTLSTDGRGMPPNGGNFAVQVQAPAGCTWAFVGNDPWVTVGPAAPAPSGTGNGTVTLTAAPNAGVRRVGSATVAYQRVTIDQAGTDGAGSCTFAIFPINATSGAAGGRAAFAVVPNAEDCGWWVEAHSPDDDWVLEDFSQGIGTGVATYRVAPSTTLPSLPLPRTGRVGLHNSANALVVDHLVTQQP
jgi:hypothetical protein